MDERGSVPNNNIIEIVRTLADFGELVLLGMTNTKEWDADLLEWIKDAAVRRGLATVDPSSLFTHTLEHLGAKHVCFPNPVECSVCHGDGKGTSTRKKIQPHSRLSIECNRPHTVRTISFASFKRANRDHPDLCQEVAQLDVGDRMLVGGGAAPAISIMRVS
jgi:hypothetical protein